MDTKKSTHSIQEQFAVLKFYCYAPVNSTHELKLTHHQYCLEHGLYGRVKIASEGINGTVSGTLKACKAYRNYLKTDLQFTTHIFFNLTPTAEVVHPKLQVKIKSEIVNSGLEQLRPSTNKEERCYISPREYRAMRKDPNVVLIDVRSNYEHKLGKFDSAITLNINTFREFPDALRKMNFDPKKTYVTCCTGGIKSEKARDFLKQELKLPKVHHLCGGVLEYAKATDGQGFNGECYVFDSRIHSSVNYTNSTTISKCYNCKEPSRRMVNCANPHCNIHTTICIPCSQELDGACSLACYQHADKRPYNSKGYYFKPKNGYNPHYALQQSIKYTTDLL